MEATIRRAEADEDSRSTPSPTPISTRRWTCARKAEAKYAKGARTGALEGLPVGIKDES